MLKLSAKLIVATAISGGVLSVATLPLAAHGDTQTTNTQVTLAVNAVISSYSSGPTVTLGAITPDTTGRQSIAADTVTAATNDTAGFTVTLQEQSATSTAMTSGANNINAGSGTTASPTALVNGTWGWRIDNLGGFGAGPTSTASNTAPSALTFAGIPANGSPATIATTSTTGSASTSVWYSARVDNTQPIGTYATTVTYTITTN